MCVCLYACIRMSCLYSNALNPSSHSYDVGHAIHAMNTPLHEYIYISFSTWRTSGTTASTGKQHSTTICDCPITNGLCATEFSVAMSLVLANSTAQQFNLCLLFHRWWERECSSTFRSQRAKSVKRHHLWRKSLLGDERVSLVYQDYSNRGFVCFPFNKTKNHHHLRYCDSGQCDSLNVQV